MVVSVSKLWCRVGSHSGQAVQAAVLACSWRTAGAGLIALRAVCVVLMMMMGGEGGGHGGGQGRVGTGWRGACGVVVGRVREARGARQPHGHGGARRVAIRCRH
jgi:hypothetical protein